MFPLPVFLGVFVSIANMKIMQALYVSRTKGLKTTTIAPGGMMLSLNFGTDSCLEEISFSRCTWSSPHHDSFLLNLSIIAPYKSAFPSAAIVRPPNPKW